MTTQFDNVYCNANPRLGKLRLVGTGLGWKALEAVEGDEVITLNASDMKALTWTRVARDFQLAISKKSTDDKLIFEGFSRDDHDRLASHIKNAWAFDLDAKEVALKGWNWGKVEVQGPNLAFMVNSRPSFLLPLSSIANSNIAGKTEVAIEMAQPKGPKPKGKQPDELVEIRFHIPGTIEKSDAGSEKGSDDEDDDEISAAQAFHDTIKDRVDSTAAGGLNMCVLNEILVLTPRGRYDIDVFLTHFRLRGKTYDYKVLTTSVTRIYLLPKADDIHVQLVIGLDPPIRQGQTRYPFLVMQFTKDEELEVDLTASEEELTEHNLKGNYSAPAFQVVSQIFKGLTGKRVQTPADFTSKTGMAVIKCNLKAVQGELYFLDKGFIFIAKQPVLVEFSNVAEVTFSRVGGTMVTSKSFDLNISLKNRHEGASDHSFTGISRDENEGIKAFLASKNVRFTDETEDDMVAAVIGSDDDDDMDVDDQSDDDEDDRSKAKSKSKDKAAGRPSNGADDDDESDDESFQGGDSDDGSATEDSSDDDSGAETASDASGDVSMKVPKKKKKKQTEDGEPPKKKKKKTEEE